MVAVQSNFQNFMGEYTNVELNVANLNNAQGGLCPLHHEGRRG